MSILVIDLPIILVKGTFNRLMPNAASGLFSQESIFRHVYDCFRDCNFFSLLSWYRASRSFNLLVLPSIYMSALSRANQRSSMEQRSFNFLSAIESECIIERKNEVNEVARTFRLLTGNGNPGGRGRPRTGSSSSSSLFFPFPLVRLFVRGFPVRFLWPGLAWSFASTIAPRRPVHLGCKGNRANVSRPRGGKGRKEGACTRFAKLLINAHGETSFSVSLSPALAHRPVYSAIIWPSTWKRVRVGRG